MNHATTHAEQTSWATSRRGFLGLALGASATGLLAACSGGGGSSDTVRIINTSATGAVALNHMLSSGKYFEKFGVNAQISNLTSGNQIVAALASGSADITILSGLVGILPGIEQGMDLKVLGGTQVVSTSALFSGDPQIRTAADLGGKTLGTGAVGSELYEVFSALLTKYRIPRTDVTFRNIGSSAQSLQAALAKQIDCGYGQVGDQPLATQHGCRMIATVSQQLPLWMNNGAVASAKAISSKRGSLVKVLAAYAQLFKDLTTSASKAPYVAAYIAAGGSQAGGEAEWQYLYQNTAYSPTLDLPSDKVEFIQQQNVASGTQKQVMAYNSYTDLTLRTAALALVK